MHIVVVGCGRTGALLARSLAENGHQVAVVDSDPDQFWRLGSDFCGRTVEGVAFDQDTLIRAGIEEADGVAVVTDDDIVNLTVARAARWHFQVPNVVVRLFDPERAVLYETIGVSVVTTVSWRVARIEQLLCRPTLQVTGTLGNGEVSLVDLSVPDRWAGRSLSAVPLPPQTIPIALTRRGSAMLAAPEVVLEEGDLLHLAVAADGLDSLQAGLEEARGEQDDG